MIRFDKADLIRAMGIERDAWGTGSLTATDGMRAIEA